MPVIVFGSRCMRRPCTIRPHFTSGPAGFCSLRRSTIATVAPHVRFDVRELARVGVVRLLDDSLRVPAIADSDRHGLNDVATEVDGMGFDVADRCGSHLVDRNHGHTLRPERLSQMRASSASQRARSSCSRAIQASPLGHDASS